MAITEDILRFWFGTTDCAELVEKREIWFKSTPSFDQNIKNQFLNTYKLSAENKLDHLLEEGAGCLALIILLDQFPRNIFRHSALAYATDQKARSVAIHAINCEFDHGLSPWHKAFLYLPFEHSENIADQNQSVELFTQLNIEDAIEAAVDHRDIIRKFGRFPYRNKALGRSNTPAEEEYLKHPPPWGKTKSELLELGKI